jgi:hypothetical protein
MIAILVSAVVRQISLVRPIIIYELTRLAFRNVGSLKLQASIVQAP